MSCYKKRLALFYVALQFIYHSDTLLLPCLHQDPAPSHYCTRTTVSSRQQSTPIFFIAVIIFSRFMAILGICRKIFLVTCVNLRSCAYSISLVFPLLAAPSLSHSKRCHLLLSYTSCLLNMGPKADDVSPLTERFH